MSIKGTLALAVVVLAIWLMARGQTTATAPAHHPAVHATAPAHHAPAKKKG